MEVGSTGILDWYGNLWIGVVGCVDPYYLQAAARCSPMQAAELKDDELGAKRRDRGQGWGTADRVMPMIMMLQQ